MSKNVEIWELDDIAWACRVDDGMCYVARGKGETKEYLHASGNWIKGGQGYKKMFDKVGHALNFYLSHRDKDRTIASLRKQLKELGGELKKVKAEKNPDVLPEDLNGWNICSLESPYSCVWKAVGDSTIWLFADGTIKEQGDFSKKWKFDIAGEAELALDLYLRKQKGE